MKENVSMSDFDAVKGIADQAQTIIDEYNNNITELFKIVEETRDVWKGGAAEDSLQKIEEYRPDFENLRDNLLNYPSVVKAAVQNHINADQEISSWRAN